MDSKEMETAKNNLVKLETVEECEQFSINVAQKYPELSLQARRLAVELRAKASDANSVVERKALEAVYAYEAVLTEMRGKKTRASRTWQMIRRRGIIGAVEQAVTREDDLQGYKMLVRMGLNEMSFEEVVLQHPSFFSSSAIKQCQERIARYQKSE